MSRENQPDLQILLSHFKARPCSTLDGGLSIHTLGPEGTSSEYAAMELLRGLRLPLGQVRLHESFESAFEAAARDARSLLLVANAYFGVDSFYMSSELSLIGCFILDTPGYGLAARSDWITQPERTRAALGQRARIASHHAPVSRIPALASRLGLSFTVELMPSTSESARRVQIGDYDLCVTNEIAARRYGLTFLTETQPITMLWSLFGSQEAGSLLANTLLHLASPPGGPAPDQTARSQRKFQADKET